MKLGMWFRLYLGIVDMVPFHCTNNFYRNWRNFLSHTNLWIIDSCIWGNSNANFSFSVDQHNICVSSGVFASMSELSDQHLAKDKSQRWTNDSMAFSCTGMWWWHIHNTTAILVTIWGAPWNLSRKFGVYALHREWNTTKYIYVDILLVTSWLI